MDNDDAGETPKEFLIIHKLVHPNYAKKPSLDNDIAILTLDRDVEFVDKKIQPICLPLPEFEVHNAQNTNIPASKITSFVGFHPHVAGWGALGYRKPTSPNLMEVQLEVNMARIQTEFRIQTGYFSFSSHLLLCSYISLNVVFLGIQ